MTQIKPFYRVEDNYCTCCHEEDGHKKDCPLVTWEKEDVEKKNGLYAIHISGPDSILAVESFKVGKQKEAELNKLFSTFAFSDLVPQYEANIVDWPYDRESHADAVLDADWIDIEQMNSL